MNKGDAFNRAQIKELQYIKTLLLAKKNDLLKKLTSPNIAGFRLFNCYSDYHYVISLIDNGVFPGLPPHITYGTANQIRSKVFPLSDNSSLC